MVPSSLVVTQFFRANQRIATTPKKFPKDLDRTRSRAPVSSHKYTHTHTHIAHSTMIRSPISRALRARLSSTTSRRTLYTVPEVKHINAEVGVPGLYSAEGFDIVWRQAQSHAAAEFNTRLQEIDPPNAEGGESASTGLQNLDISTAIMMSKVSAEADKTVSFYASQLYNNQFFIEGLFQRSRKNDATGVQEPIQRATRDELYRDIDISSGDELVDVINVVPPTSGGSGASAAQGTNMINLSSFTTDITSSFGSVISFKELLLAKAEAIFGDGYTWLVLEPQSNKLYVYNTYGWGTPPMFHDSKLKSTAAALKARNSTSMTSFNDDSSSVISSHLVSFVIPILNINVWQHAYLHDYGVFGKRRYLENVWDSIDWVKVTDRFNEAKNSAKDINIQNLPFGAQPY